MATKTKLVCDLCERELGSMSDSWHVFLIDGVKRDLCKICENILQRSLEMGILRRYLLITNQEECLLE